VIDGWVEWVNLAEFSQDLINMLKHFNTPSAAKALILSETLELV
jgi:hypothetical protein